MVRAYDIQYDSGSYDSLKLGAQISHAISQWWGR